MCVQYEYAVFETQKKTGAEFEGSKYAEHAERSHMSRVSHIGVVRQWFEVSKTFRTRQVLEGY